MDIHANPMSPTIDRSASRSGTSPPGGKPVPAQSPNMPPPVSDPLAFKGRDPADADPNKTHALDAAVEQINDFVQVIQRDLEFSIDDATGHTIVKVFDRHTQELIRQVPPEEFLAIVAHLEEVKEGLLVKEQA
ncbi:flagellar protein FlaG [Ectothiorhodospira magna]|uniref:Flagellar protein FlaG n=1 Tax=Ectothiorhodospira magna TaxID=867345 RepID=A0A1H9A4X4_9GAMM|nr:flagellar protein FlaG [Ectothiorhodospira magna]SEP71038.1 flagellar protein FlaG [Ectothiorhodospira magna]